MGQIDNFRAQIVKADGLARQSKFKVIIRPPDWLVQYREGIELFCSDIEMPGHDLETVPQQHSSAPTRNMVTHHDFGGSIQASFYLSADLNEKSFFEAWQNTAVNPITHKANYYNNYVGSLEIYQLSQESGTKSVTSGIAGANITQRKGDLATYGIDVTEVYPETIGAVDYSYSQGDEFATLDIEFGYREWRNKHISGLVSV
tara:strand:- start:937 stop:1542 length:606 start_codon:yes stop_codon:yes gene_type:complete